MELRSDGYSAGLCLDFDQACAAFWNLIVLSGREQRIKRRLTSEEKLKEGQTWAPKYTSDTDILKHLYYPGDFVAPLDPVVQAMSPAEIDAIMDTWDPYAGEA